jgi:hypothetical protein
VIISAQQELTKISHAQKNIRVRIGLTSKKNHTRRPNYTNCLSETLSERPSKFLPALGPMKPEAERDLG